MADYAISNVPRRVVYAPSGVGPYAFTFEILEQTDIAVYKGNTLLTLTTDYTVTINLNGTGSVTLTATAGTSNITIIGARAIQRSSDYTTGGDLFASTLNTDLDSQTIFSQQVAETVDRSVKGAISDSTALNMSLPPSQTRANKLLGFSNSGEPSVSSTTIAQLDAAVSSFVSGTGNNAATVIYAPSGTGAVSSTVQAKLRESVSVKDFGAVGNGVADDTTAIQNAINACLTTGSSLYIPSGTYIYTPSNTFNIDVAAAAKQLTIFGDGQGSSIININYNGIAFNVRTNFGNSSFQCSNIQFKLLTPVTNNNATCLYISNGTGWGAQFTLLNCRFTGFTNCAVHAIRAFNSQAINCWFVGNSPYTTTSGLLTTYDDAGIRLWGADGTLTVQDHSFCNVCRFENCFFGNVRYGVDGWNMTQCTFTNCTFEFNWIGLINRPNLSTSGGSLSSLEKGGYAIARATIDNCWFENYAKYPFTQYDIDPATGLDVNTNRACIYTALGMLVQGDYVDVDGVIADGRDKSLKGVSNYYSTTFTPNVVIGTTVQTIPNKKGIYTRIGNKIFFDIAFFGSYTESGTGNITITGLPFTSTNDAAVFESGVQVLYFEGYNGTEFAFGTVNANSTTIQLYKGGANQRQFVTDADFATATFLMKLSGSYFTD